MFKRIPPTSTSENFLVSAAEQLGLSIEYRGKKFIAGDGEEKTNVSSIIFRTDNAEIGSRFHIVAITRDLQLTMAILDNKDGTYTYSFTFNPRSPFIV